jgi:hypothetical protein
MVQPEELSERKTVNGRLEIDSLTFPTYNAVYQIAAPQRTPFVNKYIIKIDIKLCLSSPVNDFLQTVRNIIIHLVLVPLHGCTQYDMQCHFADESENRAVSILNQTTVSL